MEAKDLKTYYKSREEWEQAQQAKLKKSSNSIKVNSKKQAPPFCNIMDLEANFKPKLNRGMNMLFETYKTIEKGYRELALNTIDPESWKLKAEDCGLPKEIEEAFLNSISLCGQLSPIGVVKSKNPKYYYDVIFGKKRLRALKKRGEEKIFAIEFITDNEDLLNIAIIDESLVHVDLTSQKKAKLIAKRKKHEELLHPEMTAARQRLKGLNISSEIISELEKFKVFTKSTADLLGVSPRTIQYNIQIADNITEENHKLIEGTLLEGHQQELLKISRINDPELQTKVIKSIIENKVKNVKDALALYSECLVIDTTHLLNKCPPEKLKLDLKIIKGKNKELKNKYSALQKENENLAAKVKTLEEENLRLSALAASVREFNLYPYTDTNKDSIQELAITGGDKNE